LGGIKMAIQGIGSVLLVILLKAKNFCEGIHRIHFSSQIADIIFLAGFDSLGVLNRDLMVWL
jgi:hypothetical protein